MLRRAVLFVLFCLSCRFSYAQPLSSIELINNSQQSNGKVVIYQGEVIGEVMRRGDFAWVNLHDGKNAIGIWVPWQLAESIVYAGSYKARGDVIEVTGIFNRACPEHGGDLDIHAQVLRKIASGRLLKEKLNLAKRNQVLILLGVLFLVWILTLFLRK